VLPPGPDVHYFDHDEALVSAAESLRGDARRAVRDLGHYSWRAIADRIVSRLCDAPGARAS
jgi:hypothetical protein